MYFFSITNIYPNFVIPTFFFQNSRFAFANIVTLLIYIVLKKVMKSINLIFFLILLVVAPLKIYSQVSSKMVPGVSDEIESTPQNEDKRNIDREFLYFPDGEDFVSINGENRYTRALYGSHTAWRLETSDRPIFATYVKNDSRNIRFCLILPNKTRIPLEMTSWCEARYTPGRRSYLLKDDAFLGGIINISVLASPTIEAAIWEIKSSGLPKGCLLEALNTNIKNSKLSRSGDLGVDPKDSFDPIEDGSIRDSLVCLIDDNTALYIKVYENTLSKIDGKDEFELYEEARKELASRVKILTPDAFFNTLGGALAVAADGIWSEEGVWLHGAVGWRMPLNGWRAAYVGDIVGWHDRSRTHFDNYSKSQVTQVPCVIDHPAQDSLLSLARSEKRWGTPQYSNGYICRNPSRNDQMHHYDMNLCYIDELLWHLNFTGDLDYAKKMWPTIKLHLAWEKLNFDPDDDGLYDAYASIWASDALYYDSGGVTHSSAYNYRSNLMAAMIAQKISEDPMPYKKEAEKILNAISSRLWLKDKGHWAEFQDYMGHKLLHESAAIWSIYHAIDNEVGDSFERYLSTLYVDREIPHIPIVVNSCLDDLNLSNEAKKINSSCFSTISTTSWMPYSWSINNVAQAEVMNMALAYFEAGRHQEGFKLLKAFVLDGMYLGKSPANFGQISFYDAARGECYRDFGDPIGVASRVLIEGLFGMLPDALNSRLVLNPGFPLDWSYASLHTPDIDFDFKLDTLSNKETFFIVHHFEKVDTVELIFPGRLSKIKSLTINDKDYNWEIFSQAIDYPKVKVKFLCKEDEAINISIIWDGQDVLNPLNKDSYSFIDTKNYGPFTFKCAEKDDMKWWVLTSSKVEKDDSDILFSKASVDIGKVLPSKCKTIKIDKVLNSNVTDIFKNKYLSPRSPYTTLQIPVQGIGEWCHPLMTADIDDTGLREAISNDTFSTDLGIPFISYKEGYNIAYTSLFDNYPDSINIDLQGKACNAYLLMAGSTNHMQSNFENARIRVYYMDGEFDELKIINPINWAPIEQAFYEDHLAFNRKTLPLTRLELKTAKISNHLADDIGAVGAVSIIDGGAATILKMPLNKTKKLKSLTLECLASEVVVGIMAITLER